MATTRPNSVFYATLDAGRTFFQQKLDEIRAAQAKRKLYHETYAELAGMSDRNLKDLGISRSGIQRLALDAAYGL